MGYWLVMAMVVCALIAVIAVFAGDQDDTGLVRPAPSPARKDLIWAALGGSDGVGVGTPDPAHDNWINQLAATLPPEIALHNFSAGGSTLAEAQRDQVPPALAIHPDVVSLWLVVQDLAGGTPLEIYRQTLHETLAALCDAGCQVVVGNAIGGEQSSTAPNEAQQVAAWNAAIAREAAAAGAALVDLAHEDPALAGAAAPAGPDRCPVDPAAHGRLAACFRPAIIAAIDATRRLPA